jgi:hypothetical protein
MKGNPKIVIIQNKTGLRSALREMALNEKEQHLRSGGNHNVFLLELYKDNFLYTDNTAENHTDWRLWNPQQVRCRLDVYRAAFEQ